MHMQPPGLACVMAHGKRRQSAAQLRGRATHKSPRACLCFDMNWALRRGVVGLMQAHTRTCTHNGLSRPVSSMRAHIHTSTGKGTVGPARLLKPYKYIHWQALHSDDIHTPGSVLQPIPIDMLTSTYKSHSGGLYFFSSSVFLGRRCPSKSVSPKTPYTLGL